MFEASSDTERSERKAKLLAALTPLSFLFCFVLFVKSAQTKKEPPRRVTNAPASTAPTEQPREPFDRLQDFRIVPARFVPVDFKHHSFSYAFSYGRKTTVTLKNGEYEYNFDYDERGWFYLRDVYYVDVTGDQVPEAIVNLTHVECGAGSCDGGAALFFIYSMDANRHMKELWQYETGSYAYGCGLKSLRLEPKEIKLELFGHCPRPAMNDFGPGKFMVQDLTRLVFRFKGQSFVRTKIEFLSAPVTDVKNYQAEVQIN